MGDAVAEAAAEVFRRLEFDEIKKLGAGGMGIAYRARSRRDGTTRVLKLNLAHVDRGESSRKELSQEDEDLLEEGKLLKSLLGLLNKCFLCQWVSHRNLT